MNVIALFGNPNTGKTSLFNKMTRSYANVGNWSGVTVEKKVGLLRNRSALLIDLPGTYSLQPLSLEEGVTSRFLIEEPPNRIINIVDASQLERNLYLTVQLLEYGQPLVLGLNMIDVARIRGLQVKSDILAHVLGIPVIATIARSGQGTTEILHHISTVHPTTVDFQLNYGIDVELTISLIGQELEQVFPSSLPNRRWLALQLLEGNPVVQQLFTLTDPIPNVFEHINRCVLRLQQIEPDCTIAEKIRQVRSRWIHDLCLQAIDRTLETQHTPTEKIDRLLTHPYWGIPIFLLMMFFIFKLTFDWAGNLLADQMDALISGPLSQSVIFLLQMAHASEFTQSLIVDGIISGVGGVLVFMPQIAILFFMISWVEDSGYMARITLLMDRMMERVGLNGKTFIPFMIGFGCNVPAIMAARTIEQRKERLLTILLVPLMSCSARLPVYTLFAGVFFVRHQAAVVMSMYVMGMILALLLANLFSRSSFFAKEPSFFIVELPPYRIPQPLSLFRNTWEKVKGFLHKAGTIILAGSVIIWLLSNTGWTGYPVDMDHSFLAMIGGWFVPLLSPLGFGTWQAGASLLTGFMAKEVVVSTMNIIYHAPTTQGLEVQVAQAFTGLQAFSFMTFILLYIPCLATVSVIRKETDSWKWAFFSIGYALILAYLIAILFYQGGQLMGLS